MTNNNQKKSLWYAQQAKSAFADTVGACRHVAARFSKLKAHVVQSLIGDSGTRVPGNLLQRAVLEAEALAWSTPYPLLFLPALAEEKVLNARRWAERQRRILERQTKL
jgi:hypothetical protein